MGKAFEGPVLLVATVNYADSQRTTHHASGLGFVFLILFAL